MLKVFLHPTAQKEISKLLQQVQLKVFEKLEELEKLNHPLEHQKIIKLSGRKTEDFRLRVGDYRIKFTLGNPHTVLVTHVQHRQVGY